MWSNISPSKGRSGEGASSASDSDLLRNVNEQTISPKNEAQVYTRDNSKASSDLFKEDFKQKTIHTDCGSPVMRYKHAVCSAATGYIYIHGGRFGNLPLDDDVWRFDPHQNNWVQLETSGCKPPSLQEHTLVEYDEQLYLFGGQVSASNNENSFWRLNLSNNEWQSLSMKSSRFGAHLGPTNRRGHSAVIYSGSMYIYGGFEDFRGSSNQLWEYQLASQRWELRNLSSSSACHPEPRHSHSAIVYANSMYIYGGLSNLKPLSDLWRWSWPEKRWFKERTRGSSPGQLHGHTAIQAFGSMFVFGGERNGRTTRSLWRLNLSNMSWQKIRPKGPRPNPTTWHGAIANPLSILDEANYIIEGDPDLLLKSSQENCNVSFCHDIGFQRQQQTSQQVPVGAHTDQLVAKQAHFLNPTGRPGIKSEPQANCCLEAQNVKIQSTIPMQTSQLTHSRSSSSGIVPVNETPANHSHSHLKHERCSKRKTRLSFLRGRSRHNERTCRSTYELKHLSNTNNPVNMKSDPIRHSISAVSSERSATISGSTKVNITQPVGDDCETNIEILDNLDTDIKEMFQQALNPNESKKKSELSSIQDDLNGDVSMSVEMGVSSASQYKTAMQAMDSVNDITMRTSQRTSNAYTTPPSELNTLRGGDSSATLQSSSHLIQDGHQGASFLRVANDQSGYNRRSNRPKSEIVQSLIDRADARIKHLYTPFFNQQANVSDGQQLGEGMFDSKRSRDIRRGEQQQQRSNLDKSKRHTIHQTMTYYNLYFSEDNKSSNDSPPSDQQQNNKEAQSSVHNSNNWQPNHRHFEEFNSHMVRDDMSSNTIKGINQLTTSGTLVGVHLDQASQSSFDAATNSSDSRTLCGDLNNNQRTLPDPSDVTFTTNGSTNGLGPSSLHSALTARRETETSCDNTSLSFSAIAEFEEDDMLQYSSPTDLVMGTYEPVVQRTRTPQRGAIQTNEMRSNDYSGNESADLKRVNVDSSIQLTGQQQQDSDNEVQIEAKREKLIATHKSASSGYDSISGYEQRGPERDRSSVNQVNSSSAGSQMAGNFDTQEDSSVRSESSMGGFTTTETSPEQSASKNSKCKKMKSRPMLGRKIKSDMKVATTTSSTTADSLALTSDIFGSSPVEANHFCQPPTKSLPSSPPSEQHQTISTQSKMPLVSRSRFFSKQKSKNRYWQLCMFVIGGKQGGAHGMNEPITIWRLYI